MPKVTLLNKEANWVKQIKERDRAAERAFFEYCYDYCIKSQMRHDSESDDRFQDAFLQVWTEIQDGRIFLKDGKIWRLPKAVGSVASPMTCSLRTFIVHICNNQIMKNDDWPPSDSWDRDPPADESDEDNVKNKLIQIIHENISSMSPTCREVLTLYYVKGLKLDQIMRMRGENISKFGLKTSKSKCLQKLKQVCRTSYNALF